MAMIAITTRSSMSVNAHCRTKDLSTVCLLLWRDADIRMGS